MDLDERRDDAGSGRIDAAQRPRHEYHTDSRGVNRAALLYGGYVSTPGELRKRFADFLAEKTEGKDERTMRIVLEYLRRLPRVMLPR